MSGRLMNGRTARRRARAERRSSRGLVALLLAVVLGVALAPAAAAQTAAPAQPLYFPQTGHNVEYPFLDYFVQNGAASRFGYPITEAYPDDPTGMLIQYFQRARLEWHPGNPDPYKVQLGLLGEQLNRRQPALAAQDIPSPSDPSCHYFPETGHAACFQFLEYWRANGGLDQFGYPIAAPGLENGRIVQYFQRARLEWHPERVENQRVVLAPLGQIYFDFAQLDRGRLSPVLPNAGANEQLRTLEMRAYASVNDAVVARGGTQTAYVVVTNQLRQPFAGAAVTLIVHYPSGDQSFSLPATDSQGTSSINFPAGRFPPGTIVAMEFIVTASGLSTTTRTSYLLWYY